MDPIDAIAVVGSCPPQRRTAAKRLAEATSSAFISARRLEMSPAPIHEALALVPWAYAEGRAVVEFPTGTQMPTLINGFCAPEEQETRLVGIVCVVDAAHFLEDLGREDYIVSRTALGRQGHSRALLTATQLEFASTALLVDWESLSTPDLSTVLSLVSHLSPLARLRLEGSGVDRFGPFAPYTAEQGRPGWVGILNGDFAPHMTDPRVTALHYERIRPMHPGRLSQLLDGPVASGEFGTVVRSAGLCRLATQSRPVRMWEHVGQMFSLHPLTDDTDRAEDDEALALGQDIAIIGIDLDGEELVGALDGAALTDEEFAAGPAAWADFVDPFPASQTVSRRTE